jgi:hypothetical protein
LTSQSDSRILDAASPEEIDQQTPQKSVYGIGSSPVTERRRFGQHETAGQAVLLGGRTPAEVPPHHRKIFSFQSRAAMGACVRFDFVERVGLLTPFRKDTT